MPPQDPQSDLRALLALADSVRQLVCAELNALASAGPTPTRRRARARRYLELAQRALREGRPASSAGGRRGRSLRKGADAPLAPGRRASGPRATVPAERGAAPDDGDRQTAWARSRTDEIGRAIDSVLGGDGDRWPEAGPREPDGADRGAADGAPEVGAACPAPQAPPHFSGNTSVLSIPDLVGFFQVQSKTGVLEIQHASENFRLEFEGGALMHAASSNSPAGERLGEILVRRGALTQERLDELLGELARDEKLGTALLRLQGLAEQDLLAAIEEQVLGIFVRLAGLPGCAFTFRECQVEGTVAGRVRHNVTRLLLDSLRQLDEAAEQRASA